MDFKEVLNELKEEIYQWSDKQKICDLIILAAVLDWASDIHIEPLSHVIRLRYRVDGVLREILEYQTFLHEWIVARYKILANLKIDETRVPQDGKISETVWWKPVELRFSSLPTVAWEKLVFRIIDKSKEIPDLNQLGIDWHNMDLIQKAIKLPNWVILTSWPTWSGKSTTLFSSLKILNTPDVNIMTLEDPVENQIDWVAQSQVKPDIWYTFAAWVRAALRQDPDIILVWEMRDKETLEIGIEASLTWHLVLSTIHTNSAAETITRVIQMWLPSFLIPAAFNIVIAQRLIRRLCSCKKQVSPSELDKETLQNVKKALSITAKEELNKRVPNEIKAPKFYMPVWCEKCDNVWYKWRVWLYEVLEITDWVKEAILRWDSAFNINRVAIKDWMISLEQDWIIKALQWQTSLEEVYRVAKTQNG